MTMFNIVAPYPGTKMFREGVAEGRINNFSWEDYDFSTPILEIPGVSGEYLKKTQKRAHIKYFLRPSYLWSRAKRIKTAVDLKNVFLAFLTVTGVLTLAEKVILVFKRN